MKLSAIIPLSVAITLSFCFMRSNSPSKVNFNDERLSLYYDYRLTLQSINDSLKLNTLNKEQKNSLLHRYKELKKNEKKIYREYQESTQKIIGKTSSLIGEVLVNYYGEIYNGIIVDPKKQQIKMHWLSKENSAFKNLMAVKKELESGGKEILMLTNGGMYLKNNIPQGLFISSYKKYRSLDLDSNKYGNFYIQPNGVFFLSQDVPAIMPSQKFRILNDEKISFATQSGPLLLCDGEINSHFKYKSINFNIRSGVGILPNGNVIFLISATDRTNFHDFASIFKDVFGCRDALYLDGAISRMYLKESRPDDLGGDFGAIISVSR